MIIKYEYKNEVLLFDMVCPSYKNMDLKHAEKLQKYQQIAFEIRERPPGCNVMIIVIFIGCLGGGMRKTGTKL